MMRLVLVLAPVVFGSFSAMAEPVPAYVGDPGPEVCGPGWAPAWSPMGDRRAYWHFLGVGVRGVGLDCLGPFRLTDDLAVGTCWAERYDVHPDGKRIAYERNDGKIVIMPLD